MGDRALIQFYTKGPNGEVSPIIYLHWDGSAVGEILKATRELMGDRLGDVPYTAARCIGICHMRNPESCLSLGCWSADKLYGKDDSHGDAGVFLVDAETWEITCEGGYGLSENGE